MKRLHYIFTGLLSAVLLLSSSCVKETAILPDDGQDIRITFRTGTRSGGGDTHEGDAKDRYINSLRVLGYRMSDGTLAFNKQVYGIPTAETNKVEYEGSIDVVTGRFTIVFIANEHSDASVSTLLRGITTGTNNTLKYLEDNVAFSLSSFSSAKDIPMVTVKDNITIQGNNRIIDNTIQSDVYTDVWPVSMERLGVRIDMSLTLGEGQAADLPQNLTISNLPEKVYLFPRNNYDGPTAYAATYAPSVSGTTYTWTRIIVPESLFPDKNNKDKGLELSMKVNNVDCSAVIGADVAAKDYTLPRNTYFNITATANPVLKELECTAVVVPWNEVGQKVIFDGQYFLRVDEDEFVISGAGGDATCLAGTNYDIADRGFPKGLQVDASKIEYSSGSGWLTITGGANGDLERSLKITAAANTTGAERTATIYIKAGNMTKAIYVIQPEGPPVVPPGSGTQLPNSYVGAFWRADQTGERLIRIPVSAPNTGKWAVQVYKYGDFTEDDIVFSTEMSDDPNVGWRTDVTPNESMVANMNDAAKDAAYKVKGNERYVTGSVDNGGYIFFRIGLKTKWTPTPEKPARYAVIVLTYNNNTKYQKLWLRQGEEADYLMRPGDAGTGVDGRTLPVRYSPYNLTATTFKGSGSSTPSVTVGARGGTWTDYPTQAGAFFQWAHTNGVIAYNAAVPALNPAGWGSGNTVTAFWNNTAPDNTNQTYESCPPGYRRANDGSSTNTTSIAVGSVTAATSEMGQSLFLNPPSGTGGGNTNNSMWGYYADGFYDRRAIGTQTAHMGVAPNSAVSTDNSTVAYIGRIFFNESNNGSVFFPAPGHRSSGSLTNTGYFGYYWSSSSASATHGYYLHFGSGTTAAYRGSDSRTAGYSVRCVADIAMNRLTVSKTDLEFGFDGAAQAVDIFTDIPAGWQVDAGSKPSWVTVTPALGVTNSTTTVQISCQPNFDKERTASFRITAGMLSQEITVTQRVGCYPAYPGVIGYDPVKGDLNLEGRGVMVYFKYGGIIGMYAGNNGDTWNGPYSIAFNPSNAVVTADYLSFPIGAEAVSTVGVVDITGDFLTVANARKGNGDPCRLVGMTAAQVKAALAGGTLPDNNTWRLPTMWEHTMWTMNQTTWVTKASPSDPTPRNGHTFSGLNRGSDFVDAAWNFLPAAGQRDLSNGSVNNQDERGSYWSNTVHSIYNSYLRYFFDSTDPYTFTPQSSGFPVRCVPNISQNFARSNVVLKGDGTLTFAVTEADNATIPANSQGLHFKWGSLVGIGATGTESTEFAAEHVVFKPSEMSTTPTTWAGIPYYDTDNEIYDINRDEFIAVYPGSGYAAAAGKGDICRYITAKGWVTGRWRMPTAAEYQELYDETTIKTVEIGSFSMEEISVATGFHAIQSGRWLGAGVTAATSSVANMKTPPNATIFLPMSGNRTGDTSFGFGHHGDYWSAGPSNAVGGNALCSGNVSTLGSFSRALGFSIRCIRE